MPEERKRRISFAQISRAERQTTIFEGEFANDLEKALNPQTPVERYGRMWHVSRTQIIENRFLAGKLGFVQSKPAEEGVFDEQVEDFIVNVRPSDQVRFSHFAIDLDNRVLVFEEKPPEIKRTSFVGALGKLLKSSEARFDVALLVNELGFYEWVKTVERVFLFKGTFRTPNPSWRPRTDAVRDMITSTNADEMEMKAKVTGVEKSLNVESPFLDGIVVHADAGYGKVEARGIEDGVESIFQSGEPVVTGEITETAEDTSESIRSKLIKLLKERSSRERELQ